MTSGKKTLVSAIKPTGRPHIGNYFGAMKNFVELQNDYNALIFIANLHALTSVSNKEELSRDTLDVAIDYLAMGLDPKKVFIFKQSDTPQVAELAWVFNCLTTVPYLMRAHAFKDAEARNKDINVGVFEYPILMAADILIHDAEVVPVGSDQEQHLEITRDTARAFNRAFGETFKEPKSLIQDDVKTILGTDGQKMSKSYNNTIPLFATKDVITKAVMSIVTNSSGEKPEVLYNIHKLFNEPVQIDDMYTAGNNYKELKEKLIEDIEAFMAPLREKREKIAQDKQYVIDLLAEHGKRAYERAEEKMREVREKTGLTLS